jgi:hypothetical protein
MMLYVLSLLRCLSRTSIELSSQLRVVVCEPRRKDRLPLEAIARSLVKTWLRTQGCAIVIYKVWSQVMCFRVKWIQLPIKTPSIATFCHMTLSSQLYPWITCLEALQFRIYSRNLCIFSIKNLYLKYVGTVSRIKGAGGYSCLCC